MARAFAAAKPASTLPGSGFGTFSALYPAEFRLLVRLSARWSTAGFPDIVTQR